MRHFFTIVSVGIALAGSILFFTPGSVRGQGAGTPVTGFAWSDTVGWISMNCSDLGSCGSSNYNIAIDGSGVLSGYGWSEHVGWVSANASDLAGCPTAPCIATMSGTSLTGWLRVLGGNTLGSGGWDGFIRLDGAGYGPVVSSGVFSGYAWGSDVVGWISFSQVRTTWLPCAPSYVCISGTQRQDTCSGTIETCTNPMICSAGACVIPPPPSYVSGGNLLANPTLVRPNDTSFISWNIQDATSCTVSGNGSTWNAISSPSGGYESNTIPDTITYSLLCTGPGGTLQDSVTISVAPEWKEI